MPGSFILKGGGYYRTQTLVPILQMRKLSKGATATALHLGGLLEELEVWLASPVSM